MVLVPVSVLNAAPPNDPYYNNQTPPQVGLQQINPEAAWECSKGEGVVVAVLDTGLAPGLEDAPAATLAGDDYIASEDGSAKTDTDPNGHGSHLSGIIGAASNNEVGIAGVAPGAQILPLRVLQENLRHQTNAGGTKLSTIQGLQAAARYSKAHNVNVVVNASFGSTFANGYCAALKDINELPEYAGAKILVVAAAMNSGNRIPHYPAFCQASKNDEGQVANEYVVGNVLSVGSVDSDGTNKDKLSSFSNRGCWVNTFAPGKDVISTWPPGLAQPDNVSAADWASYGSGKYATWSGTSQAAAFVSGAAAVLWSMAPEKSAEDIIALLRQSSDPVTGLVCSAEVNGQKRGRINLSAAMAQVPNKKCTPTPPQPPILTVPQAPRNLGVQVN